MPIKRKSERNDTPNISEEEEDEDTEDIIKGTPKNRHKKFFRNTHDESETKQPEADVILVIPLSSRQQ
jgi:hypothetical protein